VCSDRVGGHAGQRVKPFDLSYYEDLYDVRIHIKRIAVGRLCAMARAPHLSGAMAFWCQPESKRELDGRIVAQDNEKLHEMLIQLGGNRERSRTHRDLTERASELAVDSTSSIPRGLQPHLMSIGRFLMRSMRAMLTSLKNSSALTSERRAPRSVHHFAPFSDVNGRT